MRDNIEIKKYRLKDGNSSNGLLADAFFQVNYTNASDPKIGTIRQRHSPNGATYSAWHGTVYNVLFFDGHAKSVGLNVQMFKKGLGAVGYNDYPADFWKYIGIHAGEVL